MTRVLGKDRGLLAGCFGNQIFFSVLHFCLGFEWEGSSCPQRGVFIWGRGHCRGPRGGTPTSPWLAGHSALSPNSTALRAAPVNILEPNAASWPIPGPGGHCLCSLLTRVPCLEAPACSRLGTVYSSFKAKLSVTTSGKPSRLPWAAFLWAPQSPVGTAPWGVISVFTCCSPRQSFSRVRTVFSWS